jgi:hypothetical protein
LETAGAITDPRARVNILLWIASVQKEIGQISEARKTRQEALQFAKNITDSLSKVLALRHVALALAECEGRSTALETLRQAQQAATAIQDPDQKGTALLNLVLAQLLLADYEGALRTATGMKELEPTALRHIAGRVRKENGQAGRIVLKQVLDRLKSSGSLDILQLHPHHLLVCDSVDRRRASGICQFFTYLPLILTLREVVTFHRDHSSRRFPQEKSPCGSRP